MGSIGFWEIAGLAVLALFIFGPERLPGIARTVGKTISQVRREATRTLGDLRDAAGLDEDITELTREARELRSSLKDVRSTATKAIIGPMDEVRTEVGDVRRELTDEVKGVSAGGPRDVAVTAQGLVPGAAPFDPDAT